MRSNSKHIPSLVRARRFWCVVRTRHTNSLAQNKTAIRKRRTAFGWITSKKDEWSLIQFTPKKKTFVRRMKANPYQINISLFSAFRGSARAYFDPSVQLGCPTFNIYLYSSNTYFIICPRFAIKTNVIGRSKRHTQKKNRENCNAGSTYVQIRIHRLLYESSRIAIGRMQYNIRFVGYTAKSFLPSSTSKWLGNIAYNIHKVMRTVRVEQHHTMLGMLLCAKAKEKIYKEAVAAIWSIIRKRTEHIDDKEEQRGNELNWTAWCGQRAARSVVVRTNTF